MPALGSELIPETEEVPERGTGWSLLQGVSWLYVAQFSNFVFPLLTFPYIVRTVGLANFGQLQILLSYSAIGTLTTDWGFNFSATHLIAQARGDRQSLDRIASNTLGAKIVLFLVWLLSSGAIAISAPRASIHPIYFAAAFIVFATTTTPGWLCQGLEKFRDLGIGTLLVRILGLVLTLTLVRAKQDAPTAAAIYAAQPLFLSAWLWTQLFAQHSVSIKTPKLHEILRALRAGIEVFVMQLTITSYTTAAVIIVSTLGGLEAAGVYSVVDKLISASKAVLFPVTQVAFVNVSASEQPTRRAFLDVTKKPFGLLFGVALAMVFVLLTTRQLIFQRVLHVPLSSIAPILSLLVWTLPIGVLAHWFVTVGLLARGRRRECMAIVAGGLLAGVCVAAVTYRELPPGVLVAVSVLTIDVTIFVVGYARWRRSWR